jgi:hypothetical protein
VKAGNVQKAAFLPLSIRVLFRGLRPLWKSSIEILRSAALITVLHGHSWNGHDEQQQAFCTGLHSAAFRGISHLIILISKDFAAEKSEF